jgi:hypothetical protein
LNGNVVASEAEVIARVGGMLSGTMCTIYGLMVPEDSIRYIMNLVANGEKNELGQYYTSTNTALLDAIKAYQTVDCAYQILLSLPGYVASFGLYTGSQHINLASIVQFITQQAARFLKERDRAFNQVQQSLGGLALISAQQPGYSTPSPPIY